MASSDRGAWAYLHLRTPAAGKSSTKKEVISMNKTNLGVALVTGASTGIGHATAKACRTRAFACSEPAVVRSPNDPTALPC